MLIHEASTSNGDRDLKILSWNINGLRAVLRRQFGSVSNLLGKLKADIICFQETKLTKADFDRDLAIVEGWDSFYSINKGGSAYSGTATFCRDNLCPAFAAEEGVTGILHTAQELNDLADTGANCLTSSTWSRFSREELEAIDNEGRCVITDHGDFVLFNVYGPAISSEESAAKRFAFKLQFYKALETRMEALRSRGRRVILLGDLNISPAPIDSCEAGPEFSAREDRLWLNDYFQRGATDVFRTFHPMRKNAYTCWSQASGARVNNWGARIDLIVAIDHTCNYKGPEGKFRDVFTGSDIWPELQGSDHCPAWADMKLPPLLSAPICPPAFSTKNSFTGKQNKLTGWLQRKPTREGLLAAEPETKRSDLQVSSSLTGASEKESVASQSQTLKSASSVSLKAKGGAKKARDKSKGPIQSSLKLFMKTSSNCESLPPRSSQGPMASSSQRIDAVLDRPSALHEAISPDDRPRTAGAATLDPERSQKPNLLSSGLGTQGSVEEPPDPDSLILESQREADLRQEEEMRYFEDLQERDWKGSSGRLGIAKPSAVEAWNKIKDKMKPPKCKGHNEDCVIRQVKKKGPNNGRLFYVCARPDGAPPTGRCDFFVWAKH